MTAPELSPEEQKIVARFDAAPTLPEAYQPSPLVALLDQLDAAREAARDGGWPGVERMQLIDEAEPKLTAAVRAVLALHRPYRIYDACSHRHDEEDVRAGRAISVEDVGYTCAEGLMYETCWACCTEESDYQTESCATNHTHGADVPICSTVAAITAALSVTP